MNSHGYKTDLGLSCKYHK